MFAHFTDRDGKYQLASLAESGFDPLARTCRFMLTEEAHHLFVGESGVGRVISRTCQLMKEHNTDIVSEYGGIDLDIIQKYINFHYSVSLDLFGSELSTNAANYYSAGLKGRFKEADRDDDHQLTQSSYAVMKPDNGTIVRVEQPALIALNETLRDSYIGDCERALARWNKIIREAGHRLRAKVAASRDFGARSANSPASTSRRTVRSLRTTNGSGANQTGYRRRPSANSWRR